MREREREREREGGGREEEIGRTPMVDHHTQYLLKKEDSARNVGIFVLNV